MAEFATEACEGVPEVAAAASAERDDCDDFFLLHEGPPSKDEAF